MWWLGLALLACCTPPAGAFAVGASYEFNRFRKDVPRKFILLPTAGLIATILAALAAEYALHVRL